MGRGQQQKQDKKPQINLMASSTSPQITPSSIEKTNSNALENLSKSDLISILQDKPKFRRLEVPYYKGYDEKIKASEWISLYDDFADDVSGQLTENRVKCVAIWKNSPLNGISDTLRAIISSGQQ